MKYDPIRYNMGMQRILLTLTLIIWCFSSPVQAAFPKIDLPKDLTQGFGVVESSPLAATGEDVQLLSELQSIKNQKNIVFGLQMTLPEGWHTYWRTAGDSGYGLKIDTAGSENIAKAELLWPVPHRFEFSGFTNYGYENKVVFPLLVTVDKSGRPVKLNLKIDYLLCKDICMPKTLSLAKVLPLGFGQVDEAALPILRAALEQAPQKSSAHLSVEQAVIDGDHLLIKTTFDHAPIDPEAFMEFSDSSLGLVGDVKTSVRGNSSVFDVAVSNPNHIDLTGVNLTVTIKEGANFVEWSGHAKPDLASVKAENTPQNSVPFLIFICALVGGFILNFMPCVLPVLSIKLLSVLKEDIEKKSLHHEFIASFIGITFSILLLAFCVIFLREAGHQVGWGFQFQSPLFLGFMVAVLGIFGMSLLVGFDVRLPSFLNSSIAHLDQKLDQKSSLTKSFFEGALATLLATPCTAPFLGTALAYALGHDSLAIIIIFLCVGIGLGLPYLMVAIWPKIIFVIPRPGAWMVRFKKLMGVGLLLTALWLGAIIVRPVVAPTALPWQEFDKSKISRGLLDHKIVLVDMTARWCLTCKVNEKFVMESPAIKQALSSPDVLLLRGDWTLKDEKISAFMASYQRFGVPFNAVFGEGAPNGLLLPELLTQDLLLEALTKAKK